MQMQAATGTVIDGKIVLGDVALEEGAIVAVVTRGADRRVVLTEAQEQELVEALAEIERGEFVTLEDLLRSLPNSD
jgi:predicted transcriptional regulator